MNVDLLHNPPLRPLRGTGVFSPFPGWSLQGGRRSGLVKTSDGKSALNQKDATLHCRFVASCNPEAQPGGKPAARETQIRACFHLCDGSQGHPGRGPPLRNRGGFSKPGLPSALPPVADGRQKCGDKGVPPLVPPQPPLSVFGTAPSVLFSGLRTHLRVPPSEGLTCGRKRQA